MTFIEAFYAVYMNTSLEAAAEVNGVDARFWRADRGAVYAGPSGCGATGLLCVDSDIANATWRLERRPGQEERSVTAPGA